MFRVVFVVLGVLLLSVASATAQIAKRTDFFLEPGLQYGRAVEQVRFRESTERVTFDVGVRTRWGDVNTDVNRLGLGLHASIGSRDAYFALRPRYTRRLTDMVLATFSAGWIFATPQQDTQPEDASLSDNGFVGGAQISHGDIALGVDVRVLDVGPSTGYQGGTESTILGGVSFLGKPGLQAMAFGAGVILVLSILYVASI